MGNWIRIIGFVWLSFSILALIVNILIAFRFGGYFPTSFFEFIGYGLGVFLLFFLPPILMIRHRKKSQDKEKRLLKQREGLLKKETSNKIGGWLVFFIISLVILSPLFNLFLLWSEYEYYINTGFVGIFSIIESLGTVTIFILAGIFLWKKKPYALKFVKVFLVTTVVSNIIISFIYHDFSFIAQSIGYFVIWFIYLNKSKQVKQIYGNLKETTRGYQIWSKLSIIYAFFSPIYGAVFSVVSLINISKNRMLKGMGLSVVALVVSIIMIALLFLFGMFGSGGFISIPEEIDSSCSDFCYYSSAAYYLIEYDFVTESFVCYCTDENSNILEQKSFPHEVE